MLNVGLAVDTSRLERRIPSRERLARRIAYGVVNAINDTLRTAQRAVQLHVQDTMTIRKPFVQRQAAIIKPFASVGQGRVYGEISVGQRKNLLLPGFETGALRLPFKGRSVAVPVEARPSKQASIPEELFVKNLQFKRPKATTKATRSARRKGLVGKIWEGLRGSYLIPGAGIFQHIGRQVSRVLYVFARPFRLPKTLEFVKTVTTVGKRVFPGNMKRQVDEAIIRERGR